MRLCYEPLFLINNVMSRGQVTAFAFILVGFLSANVGFAGPHYRPCLENAIIEGPMFEKPVRDEWTVRAPLMEKPKFDKAQFDKSAFERATREKPRFENSSIEKPLFDNCKTAKKQAGNDYQLVIPRDSLLARNKGAKTVIAKNSRSKISGTASAVARVSAPSRPSDCGCDQSSGRIATAPKVVAR